MMGSSYFPATRQILDPIQRVSMSAGKSSIAAELWFFRKMPGSSRIIRFYCSHTSRSNLTRSGSEKAVRCSRTCTRWCCTISISMKRGSMPIRPENKHRYPANWKQIRKEILGRAENRCEFCGVLNLSFRERFTYDANKPATMKHIRIVLTVAHLDHTPENCDPSNLRALCQRCHNRYDASHRARNRACRMNAG